MNLARAALLVLSLLYSSNLLARFEVDLPQQRVYNELGVFVLRDIGVGESAYVRKGGLCRSRSGALKLLKDTPVVADRSDYGTYYKVKRLPNGQASITIVPAKSGTKQRAIADFIKRIVHKTKTTNCQLLYSIFDYSPTDLLDLSAIEGVDSLRELMKKTAR